MARRGTEYVARLAPLADRAPQVVVLSRGGDGGGDALGRTSDGDVQMDHVDAVDAVGPPWERALQEREIRVVVKIRPLQLHYLVNGELVCVVRSRVAITAVTAVRHPASEGPSDAAAPTSRAPPPQLLVAVEDGSVSLVNLPTPDQLSVCGGFTYQLWLQQSPGVLQLSPVTSSAGLSSLSAGITPTQFSYTGTSQAGSSHTKSVWQIPGAVGLESVPLMTGMATVVRSVITPTIAICHASASPVSALDSDDAENAESSIELDELEGEQSTCTWSVHGSDQRYSRLLASLFPEHTDRVQDTLFVLQGDSDGCVRFATLTVPPAAHHPAAMQVSSSGILVEPIGEPVAAVLPISTLPAISTAHDNVPGSSDVLLVCGLRGRVMVLSPTLTEADAESQEQPKSYGIRRLRLCQDATMHSIAVVQSLGVLIYCSQGAAFACSCAELLELARKNHCIASTEVPFSDRIARRLPLPGDIARVGVASSEDSVAVLFASGRVASMDTDAFSAVVTSVLSLRSIQSSRALSQAREANAVGTGRLPSQSLAAPWSSTNGIDSGEGCIRALLEEIARISEQSAAERAQSDTLDDRLKALHSALRVQQIVKAQGTESVISCSIHTSLADWGSFAEHKTVALTCSIGFGSHSSVLEPLENWTIRVNLHPQHQDDDATTYSFPLQDPTTGAIGGDTTLVLNPETMHFQRNAVLEATCELVFHPHTSCQSDGQSDAEYQDEAAFAFSIPVGEPWQLLLVQMSQPTKQQVSTPAGSPGRCRGESSRYASRYALSDEKSSGHSAIPWWSALASHAEDNESFAEIWSKVVRMAVEHNQESERVSLTKLTSPSRFSVTIPAALPAFEKDQRDSVQIEHMLQFLGRLLPTVETSELRRSCQVVQGGRLWLTLRTLAGNLLLLKLQPQGRAGALLFVMQCSDAGELSAMRALVLETMEKMEIQPRLDPHEVNHTCSRLSVVLGSHLRAIVSLEALVEELMTKVAVCFGDPDTSSVCTDEVVHAFAQLSSIEAQALDIYWKMRRSLDKTNL